MTPPSWATRSRAPRPSWSSPPAPWPPAPGWRRLNCSKRSSSRPVLRLSLQPLPAELKAAQAPELRGIRRDHVRLMVVDRQRRQVTHTRFDHVWDFLRLADLLVVNSSR